MASVSLLVVCSWTLESEEERLAPPNLADDLLLDRRRNRGVVRELHRRRAAPLRHRSEVGHIAEHRRERDLGVDDLRVPALAHAEDAPAAGVQVADDIA